MSQVTAVSPLTSGQSHLRHLYRTARRQQNADKSMFVTEALWNGFFQVDEVALWVLKSSYLGAPMPFLERHGDPDPSLGDFIQDAFDVVARKGQRDTRGWMFRNFEDKHGAMFIEAEHPSLVVEFLVES